MDNIGKLILNEKSNLNVNVESGIGIEVQHGVCINGGYAKVRGTNGVIGWGNIHCVYDDTDNLVDLDDVIDGSISYYLSTNPSGW